MTTQLANALRFLSVDAIQKANSGHPGACMGMAEMMTALWHRYLNHNPANPHFFNRDRFVLSNGHASALLYSVLHLSGYDLSIEDLKQFRQYRSRTPGHPEYGHTPGVETTTGPLGQGLANAVGFALAEKLLAETFNRPQFSLINHYTYAFVGDGCLMEGISHEACSLAGTLGLGKLIVLYDDNSISIDGKVDGWFTEDIPMRFQAYGWEVFPCVDGHSIQAIEKAIQNARSNSTQPSLICCKTIIGKGSATREGSEKVHGSPLGIEELAATRKHLGWHYDAFEIPASIYQAWDAKHRGKLLEDNWNALRRQYAIHYPEQAKELQRRIEGKCPENFEEYLSSCLDHLSLNMEPLSTRKASQMCITLLAQVLPELLGGSADLTPSTLTDWPQARPVRRGSLGNYINYGVREFAMVAIVNGLFLHGGFRPFGSTFLMFSEYARNALRMAALMKIGSIFVFTHDSLALGEDGPTHQPVEQLATLRLIPDLDVWRPCNLIETFVAWSNAIKNSDRPSLLVLSRQNLPSTGIQLSTIKEDLFRGGYILSKTSSAAQVIILATGSEVSMALEAQKLLAQRNVAVNVVSMFSTRLFDAQPEDYRLAVLPPEIPKVAVEAGVPDLWYRYVGEKGKVIGIQSFGASAPAEILLQALEFTPSSIVEAVLQILESDGSAHA
ncbi:MAG: transketolase [Neisseriaceae bacterium]